MAIHKSLFTIVATFGLFFLLMDLYVVGYPGYYGHLMVFMRGTAQGRKMEPVQKYQKLQFV